jgi:phosphohistidine phosphatase
MKQITLIRHAKTEEIHHGINDFERQLKERGQQDAQLIANQLKDKGFLPQLIISSNATRALQTATQMANMIQYPIGKINTAPFIYEGYTTSDFLKFVSKLDNQVNSIWVVGHNPDIAQVGMKLTNENFYHFPTSASAVVEFNVDKWIDVEVRKGQLAYYVTPAMLKGE